MSHESILLFAESGTNHEDGTASLLKVGLNRLVMSRTAQELGISPLSVAVVIIQNDDPPEVVRLKIEVFWQPLDSDEKRIGQRELVMAGHLKLDEAGVFVRSAPLFFEWPGTRSGMALDLVIDGRTERTSVLMADPPKESGEE